MTLLATIAATIALALGVWCLCIIAQTARQARENREGDFSKCAAHDGEAKQ